MRFSLFHHFPRKNSTKGYLICGINVFLRKRRRWDWCNEWGSVVEISDRRLKKSSTFYQAVNFPRYTLHCLHQIDLQTIFIFTLIGRNYFLSTSSVLLRNIALKLFDLLKCTSNLHPFMFMLLFYFVNCDAFIVLFSYRFDRKKEMKQ